MKNREDRVEMVTSAEEKNARGRKQTRILAALVLVLSLIVFSPILRLGIGSLLRRDPVELGVVRISVPKSWMLSRASTKVIAWKPYETIFCGSSPRASFTVEVSELPADSDEI
jgi:hypothetical protein